jgi:hypothetical protein
MKSTYDVVALVVVRRFEAGNKCWPPLKKMAPQADLSNLRLHPAPHHAIEIEQPAGRTDKRGQFLLPVSEPEPNADALFEQAQVAEEDRRHCQSRASLPRVDGMRSHRCGAA